MKLEKIENLIRTPIKPPPSDIPPYLGYLWNRCVDHWIGSLLCDARQVQGESRSVVSVFYFNDDSFPYSARDLIRDAKLMRKWIPEARVEFKQAVTPLLNMRIKPPSERKKHWNITGKPISSDRLNKQFGSMLSPDINICRLTEVLWSFFRIHFDSAVKQQVKVFSIEGSSVVGSTNKGYTTLLRFVLDYSTPQFHVMPITELEKTPPPFHLKLEELDLPQDFL